MDLKTKLKSRKFWIGVALIVMGAVMWLLGEQKNGVTLICMGGVSYIGIEGIADIVSREASITNGEDNETSEEETEDIQ